MGAERGPVRPTGRLLVGQTDAPRSLVPDGLSIRRAGSADLDVVVELRIKFERITRDSGSMDEGGRRAELRALLGPDLASGDLAAWIAEDGGLAAGQAGLRLAAAGREGELLNVYVEPDFRGRGIGTALVGAALDEAGALGLERITLQPTDGSRRIYERAGFESDGDRMVLRLAGKAI